MGIAVQAVTALGAMISGIALVLLWKEFAKFRVLIQSAPLRVLLEPDAGYSSTYEASRYVESLSGYGIYVFRNGVWELECDLSTPGHEPAPPTLPGTYEGEAVRQRSVLKS